MHPIFASIAIAGPETVLTLGSLAALMLGTFTGGGRALTVTSLFAVAILGLAGFTLLDAPAGPSVAFDGLYVADAFSAFLKVIILAAAAASVLLALPWLADHNAKGSSSARFEYPVLLLLATLGMAIMVSANDLLTLYVGLELAALPSYVLAAFHRGDDRSAEAGLKYFVLGALASGILLYGVTLVYGFAGSTQLDVIAGIVGGQQERSLGLLFGIVFILSGLAFKVSAVPFHMWTPDVYEGAPTPVAAFFAAAPKAAALGLMARVLVVAFPGQVAPDWQQIILFIAIASMVLGAVAAVAQTNIKRLLAYSSIANIGFALVGLAPGSPGGISALLFYICVYVAMTLGSFLVVLQLARADGSPVETMADFAGLSKTRPGLALAMAVFMFSLAGIPPLLGFWPKFAVFQAAINAGLLGLAIVGFVASVVAAFYYLRLIKIMYFDPPATALAPAANPVNGAMIAGLALFCSPIGMLALSPLAAATARAAAALFPA
ncbi:NADH-quinone oxidoreductase subunit NuoN [Sandarakinorhabdus rubra]|uniref:NADH-quinone oxidoreductase subunit NuoN n=1 Tax=Sandarakinorhabdus rubra TaxID=2672568 RepID=UPI001969FB9A|nr:NADH-quinone oxidoreductase subunit NuoN [Sandarakinorhabdus rubra]